MALNPSLPVSPPWGMGKGGGAIVRPPSVGTPGVTSVIALQIPLPETQPIPDAREFNITGAIGAAGVSQNTVITGTPFATPDSTLGVVRSVTLYINNMVLATSVTWTLLINGIAPQGYSNLSIFPRVSPFVANSFDALIRFNGPANIQVLFSNADGGAYTIGAAYSGWFWPEASDARWKQFGA